ncbi:MAG: chaperone NapD [Nitrospira sp.]|nr:chaperone NapD [Nitrospira sp.]
MVVSGLLVDTEPDKLEQVKSELLKIEGIEISSVLDDHKIVIVVELEDVESEVQISKKIKNIEGVLGVNIAYHHYGDDDQT